MTCYVDELPKAERRRSETEKMSDRVCWPQEQNVGTNHTDSKNKSVTGQRWADVAKLKLWAVVTWLIKR